MAKAVTLHRPHYLPLKYTFIDFRFQVLGIGYEMMLTSLLSTQLISRIASLRPSVVYAFQQTLWIDNTRRDALIRRARPFISLIILSGLLFRIRHMRRSRCCRRLSIAGLGLLNLARISTWGIALVTSEHGALSSISHYFHATLGARRGRDFRFQAPLCAWRTSGSLGRDCVPRRSMAMTVRHRISMMIIFCLR